VFSRFFIDRPIFAAVLSIVVTLAGTVSVQSLPMAQYPQITPPTIQVQCTYPGASAQDVVDQVAAPIEQQVNGVEGMMYMSSQSTNDGAYNLTVTFKPGVDLNFAQVLVQNRVNLALPSLPDVVKQAGVTTRKRSPDILLVITLYSPDGRYDQLYLSNYLLTQVRDEMLRVDGVGDVFIFGQRDYSMRVWVDPDQLSYRGLTADDVTRAIRDQNQQVAAGQLGQPPTAGDQPFQYPVATLGRLAEPEQFAQIAVKVMPDGRRVTIKDVGRVELGPKNEDISSRVDGNPCCSLAIFQLPDANALDTADRVNAKIEELKKRFPEGVDYVIPFDTTPFIRESITEVYRTLAVAVALVALVVMLFLQSWRSALIPLVAVPVAIIGTFAVMAVLGFSINNLTLFGLVLAIGIVVDDAIVVVEAVEHHIEHGLPPRDAAFKAMEQVSGPVIAVALVLSAVFVPCAFISGITGQFFRQFALTIAVSTILSAFNSLTLSPALAALLLKPRANGSGGHDEALPRWGYALAGAGLLFWFLGGGSALVEEPERLLGGGAAWAWAAVTVPAGAVLGWFLGVPLDRVLRRFFGLFNLAFRVVIGAYSRAVRLTLRGGLVVAALLAYLVLLGGTGVGLTGVSQPAVARWNDYRFYALHWRDVLASGQDRDQLALAALPGLVAGLLFCLPLGYLLLRFRPRRRALNVAFLLSALPLFAGVVALGVVGFFAALRSGGDVHKLKLGSWDAATGLPTGYIPQQDKGYLMVAVQLPDSASFERTDRVLRNIDDIIRFEPGPDGTRTEWEPVEVRVPDTPDGRVNPDLVWGLTRQLAEAAGLYVDDARREVYKKLPDGHRGAKLPLDLDFRAGKPVTDEVVWAIEADVVNRFSKNPSRWILKADREAKAVLRREKRGGIAHSFRIVGQSFTLGANGSNFGQFFLNLDAFHERTDPNLYGDRIAERLRGQLAKEVPEANVAVFGPPAVNGLGTSNGFKIMVEDRSGAADMPRLQGQAENLIAQSKQEPKLAGLFTVFRANAAQLYADVDRKQCSAYGLALNDVFDALQVYLGSLYVNDFNFLGRTWQVIVQAEAPNRNSVEVVARQKVRNQRGEMVPLGSVCRLKDANGPLLLLRYNMYPAAPITGNGAAGVSSGESLDTMEALARRELPPHMAFEWTELAYIQTTSGNTAWVLFALAVLLVFLVLAAQYESWSLPLAVILVVPMCLLGSVVAVALSSGDVNIFTQVGFVVLVGLASKNAVLIVEFAKHKREEGKSIREATLEACKLRLRPILMTSFAFIFGVIPLMLAHGAGAEMRRALGTAVFGGMLGVTLFGVFLTPVFFFVIDGLSESRLFRAPWVVRVNEASLNVLSLKFLRDRLFNGRTTPPGPPPTQDIQPPPEEERHEPGEPGA
jgi:multidrug efflux pump subunit AcrB